MFDVQSVHCSGQAEFHTSTASDLKSGQFDRKKNCAIYFLLDTLRSIEYEFTVYEAGNANTDT